MAWINENDKEKVKYSNREMYLKISYITNIIFKNRPQSTVSVNNKNKSKIIYAFFTTSMKYMNLNFITFLINQIQLVFRHSSYQQKFINTKYQTNNLHDNAWYIRNHLLILVVYRKSFRETKITQKYLWDLFLNGGR